MMFKKGSFEIGATVYPVAIKVTFLSVFVQYTSVNFVVPSILSKEKSFT